MRELDVLLNAYVNKLAASPSAAELDVLSRFLDCSDVDLHAWLTGRSTPADADFAMLADAVRAQTHDAVSGQP